jgi:hypothetical protein
MQSTRTLSAPSDFFKVVAVEAVLEGGSFHMYCSCADPHGKESGRVFKGQDGDNPPYYFSPCTKHVRLFEEGVAKHWWKEVVR